MKTTSAPALIFLLALPIVALLGCSTTATNTYGGNGVGADAGPWPQSPNRTTNTNPNTQTDVPNAPLLIVLRGTTAEKSSMRVDITQIDFKLGDKWITQVKRPDILKNETVTPFSFGEKGGAALLANTLIPKRKYAQIRVHWDERKAEFQQAEAKAALSIKGGVFDLTDWTPDEKAPNLLTIILDGTKIAHVANSATLAAEACTVTAGVAKGSITGSVTPALPTSRIEVYWNTAKLPFRSVAPNTDGTFTVDQLPDGKYRVVVRSPGYHLKTALKDLISVTGEKPVTMEKLELMQEAPGTAT